MDEAREAAGGDPRRPEALIRAALLDGETERAFDRLTRLAARVLRVPVALVALADGGRQVFKSSVGRPESWSPFGGTPSAQVFREHVVTSGQALAVDNAPEHPLARDNPAAAEPGVAAFLGVPLVTAGGQVLGSLCVVDASPRAWSPADAETLRDLAESATAEVSLRGEVAGHRRAEVRLRLLESVVVNANDAILITEAEPIDLPGPRIVYVNEAFTRMTGHRPEEVIGLTPRAFQSPNTDRAALDRVRKALRRWRPVRVELVNNRKDGSEFWVELSIVPVANETGWYTHWVSVQRDVTDRKRWEGELQQAREVAESANRAKSVFLSRMSHELRTPLHAILGFGQLLAMDDLDADQRENVGQIAKGGRHLLGLINTVLDISRVESGEQSPAVEAVRAGQALGEALALARPLAAQAGVTLAPAGEVPDGPAVLADRGQFLQVLLNLLSNAIKYNHPGGEVVAWCHAEGGRVRVAVRDTGPGIAADVLPRLFTPFDRLGAERRAVEGTGLGLALSKRLVESMSGSLGVETEVGRGSTFWVDLPHEAGPAPRGPATPLGTPRLTGAGVTGTVLCVEDDPSSLRLMEAALGHRPGVRLLSAAGARAGFDLARESAPGLAVIDLHLPDADGTELLRWLREDERTRDVPVVVVSADATPGQAERLLAAGARRYLTKPLGVGTFLKLVDEFLKEGLTS